MKHASNLRSLAATLSIIIGSLAGTTNGAIVSADFREELDLPDYNISGPRILQSTLQPIGSGFELGEADEIANPSNWSGSLQVNLTSSELVLEGSVTNDYQTITIDISNIIFDTPGERIIGFSVVSDSAVSPYTANPIRSTSFTDNSLQISYVSDGLGSGGAFDINQTPASSTFSILTAVTPIPEPTSVLLFGLAALGFSARRRR